MTLHNRLQYYGPKTGYDTKHDNGIRYNMRNHTMTQHGGMQYNIIQQDIS